jgi:hypothetical protein
MNCDVQSVSDWFYALPDNEQRKFGTPEQVSRIFAYAREDELSAQETLWFLQSHVAVYEYDLIERTLLYGLSLAVTREEDNARLLEELEIVRRNRSER